MIDFQKEMSDVAAPFQEIAEHAGNAPIAPAHGIAAIALSMAMKYHDIATVKDGAMYQQYKLEGRNMREINIDTVFETAIQIELHLLGSSDRIAKVIVESLEIQVSENEAAT